MGQMRRIELVIYPEPCDFAMAAAASVEVMDAAASPEDGSEPATATDASQGRDTDETAS